MARKKSKFTKFLERVGIKPKKKTVLLHHHVAMRKELEALRAENKLLKEAAKKSPEELIPIQGTYQHEQLELR
jgi:hypothetical protein